MAMPHAVITCFAEGLIGVVRARPAVSTDYFTADLARGRPNIGRAETWREFGSLRGLDFHEAGEGPQTGEHGNFAVIDFKSVETESDFSVCGFPRSFHRYDCAEYFRSFGTFPIVRQRHFLHDADGHNLSWLCTFRGQTLIESHRENGSGGNFGVLTFRGAFSRDASNLGGNRRNDLRRYREENRQEETKRRVPNAGRHHSKLPGLISQSKYLTRNQALQIVSSAGSSMTSGSNAFQ